MLKDLPCEDKEDKDEANRRPVRVWGVWSLSFSFLSMIYCVNQFRPTSADTGCLNAFLVLLFSVFQPISTISLQWCLHYPIIQTYSISWYLAKKNIFAIFKVTLGRKKGGLQYLTTGQHTLCLCVCQFKLKKKKKTPNQSVNQPNVTCACSQKKSLKLHFSFSSDCFRHLVFFVVVVVVVKLSFMLSFFGDVSDIWL